MDFDVLKKILEKFKKQTCSAEEMQLLDQWLEDDNNAEQIKETLLNDLHNFKVPIGNVERKSFESTFDAIKTKISENERKFGWKDRTSAVRSFSISYLLKVAAILVLFFSAGSVLTYLSLHKPENNIITYNEIKVPLGARSEVMLPDGTKVWLNAGSRIRYQNLFDISNREISLEGEAYFEVAKNELLPFIVRTGDLDVVALGTVFNVRAYREEGIIETTLVEGRVSIHNNRQLDKHSKNKIFLEPSQKAVYVKDQKELRIVEINDIKRINPEITNPETGNLYIASKIDPLPIIAWKDDKLIFRSEEFISLTTKLERKYDVSISFESDAIKWYKFTGTLEDETLTQVLDVIKLAAPIDYKLKGKHVTIYENTRMTRKFIHYLKSNNQTIPE